MIVPTLELIGSDVQIADLSPYGKSVSVLFCSLLNQPRDGTDPSSCPPLAACPVGGTWTVCWEVCTCAPWGFGNLQLHFLPRRVIKPTVILKAGEGEGKDLTAGTLQPHVQ